MKKIILSIIITLAATYAYTQQGIVLTDKIIYTVKIKAPEESDANTIFENITESQRVFYAKNLIALARAGKLNAFKDENFYEQLNTEQVNNLLTFHDTAWVTTPESPNTEKMIAVAEDIYPEEITALCFIEQWTFDKNTAAISKKVIAVAPLLEVVVDSPEGDTEVSGHKLLFWIKL